MPNKETKTKGKGKKNKDQGVQKDAEGGQETEAESRCHPFWRVVKESEVDFL